MLTSAIWILRPIGRWPEYAGNETLAFASCKNIVLPSRERCSKKAGDRIIHAKDQKGKGADVFSDLESNNSRVAKKIFRKTRRKALSSCNEFKV